MVDDRLDAFMKGFTAAVQLSQRASRQGFLVEYIILAASIIDGMLRIGLVLQHQIATSSVEIPADLVYQSPEDSGHSEREIYRRALIQGVISQEVFDKLQALYTDRNRVVHRYIVSEITTEDVFAIARRFEDTVPVINELIWRLEKKQLELGVGMTVAARIELHEGDLSELTKDKHGAEWLARAVRNRAT